MLVSLCRGTFSAFVMRLASFWALHIIILSLDSENGNEAAGQTVFSFFFFLRSSGSRPSKKGEEKKKTLFFLPCCMINDGLFARGRKA